MKASKIITALTLTIALIIGSTMSAWACTGLYVGKKVSDTGNTYVGRSEDISQYYNKLYIVVPAQTYTDGEILEDPDGFTMPYPEKTYRYTGVFDTPESWDGYDMAYAEAGMNENGVSMTATVSTSYNASAREVDPLVDGGITEMSMTSVVLMQATSARNGVEILAGIIDEYGAGECNSLLISDSNETWFVEIVSGHQYAAIKMPDDMVAVIPNTMMMGAIDISDTENVIASEGLVSLAEDNGFLVTEDGKIHVAKTYGRALTANGQTRIWQGRYYFNSALAASTDMEAPYLDMFFEPSEKVSALDAMKLLGYRGAGTDYDSNVNSKIRAIGTNGQAECHIFEIDSDSTSALATVQWLAMSRAEYSLYLPTYSNLLTETLENYYSYTQTYDKNDTTAYDNNDEAFHSSMYWIFCKLNDLCDNDRENYGTNVRAFLDNYQSALIEQQYIVDKGMEKVYAKDPEAAEAIATEMAKYIAAEALVYAQILVDELEAFIDSKDEGTFTPSLLEDNVQPTYADYFEYLLDEYGIDLDDNSGLSSEESESNGNPSKQESSDPKGSSDGSTTTSAGSSGTSTPKTGDFSTPYFIGLILLIASGCILIRNRKRKMK